MGLKGGWVNCIQLILLEKCPITFHSDYTNLYSDETYEFSVASHFANIWYYQTLKNFCQSVRHTMILHCSFTLHLPGYLWGCLKHGIFISLLV